MTRSTTERLEKLEYDQSLMKKSLEEISATMSEILKKIEKPPDQETAPETPPKDKQIGPSTAQLPAFNGTDPIGWLARANQQFEIHGTEAERKVMTAVVAMEDSALYWVTWLRSRKPELTWEEFSKALVSRFDTRYKGSPYERLADVKQSGSVEDYINLFVQLAGQVPGLSDEHYLGYFMKGLADSVRGALRLLRPRDLETAMELARDVEDNLALKSGGRANNGIVSAPVRANSYLRPTFGINSGSETSPEVRGGSAPEQNANQPRFSRLSPNEYADLRAKGLCFRCKKPYTPAHTCPLKELRVLLAEEDELLDFRYAELQQMGRPFDPGDPYYFNLGDKVVSKGEGIVREQFGEAEQFGEEGSSAKRGSSAAEGSSAKQGSSAAEGSSSKQSSSAKRSSSVKWSSSPMSSSAKISSAKPRQWAEEEN